MADYTIPVTIVPAAGSVVEDGVLSYEQIDAGSAVYRRTDGKWAKSRATNLRVNIHNSYAQVP